ncbi:hypothetical protein [Flavobacterium sp. Arc2]|uniref:hypothetical protein n=1 Tax=Flavobacterium sp. Arc2 TaxID=3046685 RepID=UPI00352D0576
MLRVPVEKFNFPQYEDEDVIRAWQWFMSFISPIDWQKRKAAIESRITMEFKETVPFSEPLTEGTLLVVKDDVIGWYLYLLDMLINEPHKYENFQGARIVPVFKRLGIDLDLLKAINGIETRVKSLMKKRRLEADAILFEITSALLWARNGYEVAFLEEKNEGKTPDILATKGDKSWFIECKRQSKTADYTYRETYKRQKMVSYISNYLIKKNILLDIIFHVELESLPDTFLKEILDQKIQNPVIGKIVSNAQVDIWLDFVDITEIKKHLVKYYVKNNSPMLNTLIGKKPVDNRGFTCGIFADFFRVGDGEVNNLYIRDVENAFGVYWSCDANESIEAKARDIKSHVYKAMQQFDSEGTAVIHIGMETFDGPDVEKARFEKIKETIEKIDPTKTNLRWIFCNFFQAYSPPDQDWVFDETVSTMTSYATQDAPIETKLMIVPENVDNSKYLNHWNRPLP